MLIATNIDSSSNEYSVVNKKYVDGIANRFMKCAVAEIPNPQGNTSYAIIHNLDSENVIVDAYNIRGEHPIPVEIAYMVNDENSITVTLDSIGNTSPYLRIIVIGAIASSTAELSSL